MVSHGTGCGSRLWLSSASPSRWGRGLTKVQALIGAMKSTDVYKGAVGFAKADPRVAKALGTPLDDGLVQGNISTFSSSSGGDTGRANYTISISGPKGKGEIRAVAKKSGTTWTFSTLVLVVEGTGEKIDLNDGPQPLTAPSR